METINIEKKDWGIAEDSFEKAITEYLKNPDRQIVEPLLLKVEHSRRVAKLSRQIAANALLDEDEQELAYLIGLWHDLGRFPQYEKYQTFNDHESEDHAELSTGLVQDFAFFKEQPEDIQEIIIKAIRYHNLPAIPAKEDAQTILFSTILRDADKLDIWETCLSNLQRDGSFRLSSISYDLPKLGSISEAVLKSIMQHKPASKKELKSLGDFKLFLISMVFDLNFKVSFQLLSEKQMVKRIYDTLPKRDGVIDAYREVRLFIENKFVN